MQIILVLLVAIWFVDRGGRRPTPADRSLLPAVSAAPVRQSGAVNRAVRREGDLSAGALASLLFSVNSALGDRSANRIASAILRSSDKYGLDPVLVTAVVLVESRVRPWARSPKGAMGLMQVMPYMIEPLRLAGNPATIESNIEAGCWILASNIGRLGEANGISTYFWGSEVRGGAYLQKVRAAEGYVRSYLSARPLVLGL